MNIAQLAIKRPVFIVMIVLSIITLGLIGYSNLSVDLMPNIDFPNIIVEADYQGASSEEMENLFTKPMENALGSVAGLDTMTSTSREGQSTVVLQFKLDTDIKFAEIAVREKAQLAQAKLPSDAPQMLIRRFSTDDIPIMRLSLVGNRNPGDLRDIMDSMITPKMSGLAGVGSISLNGSRQKQIRINLDQSLLAANGLTYGQVMTAITKRNVSIPVGQVNTKGKDVTIRVSGTTSTLDDVKNVNLTTLTGKIIRVGDIANVVQTLEDETSRARVNGKPAILFSIVKQSGENTVAIAKEVRDEIVNLNKLLPAGVQIHLVSDSSLSISRAISGVQSDILTGMLLAIVIVWLFLGNIRSTFITAIALPNSLLGAFFLINGAGFSINTITLMALSLAVGLLIDDSIVVRENIFRHIEEGEDPKTAAENGTNEVALAVLSTTLSIMAVFIPISFMSGIIGRFFKQFGLTVAFALLISLVDAFTTAPMLSAYWYSDNKKTKTGFTGFLNQLSGKWDEIYKQINQFYSKVLLWSLNHKKMVLSSIAGMFIVSVIAAQFIGSNFVNPTDSGTFTINLSTFPGAPLDRIDNVVKDIEDFISKQPYIADYYSTVGGDSGSQIARMTVDLVGLKQRKISTTSLVIKTRNYINSKFAGQLTFNLVETQPMGGGGGRGGAIQINIIGANLDTLNKLSQDFVKAVAAAPGAIEVVSSFTPGTPEWVLKLDPIKAEKAGFTSQDLGNTLRVLIQGAQVSVLTVGDNDYNIMIQMNDSVMTSKDDVKNLLVTTKTGYKIPLSSICTISDSSSPLTISHESKQRVVRVSANTSPGYALADVTAAAKRNIDSQVIMPSGYYYEFGGQQQTFAGLGQQILLAMAMAVLFMYMILASLYNSFIQPLYIMVSLPLAFIGAFIALLITGTSLDIYGYIGFIMVLGLVAKNAILLMDFTNKMREQGMSIREAILHAGPVRLRPILMTSFAIICGMLPMALGLNEGSSGRQALPVSVIGGILTSTFLTLVVVPIIYEWAENRGDRRKKRKA